MFILDHKKLKVDKYFWVVPPPCGDPGIQAFFFILWLCYPYGASQSSLLYFFFFFCLWLHLQLMKVSRLGLNQSCSCRTTPQRQQCGKGAEPMTYIVACSNGGSLTHWARRGIEPTSSRRLCWFLTHNRNSSTIFLASSCPKNKE